MVASRVKSRRWFLCHIRGRYTLTVGFLFLIVLSVLGVLIDLELRNKIEGDIFQQGHRAIIDWSSAMVPGYTPPPEPAFHDAYYLELVDSRGRVVAANANAKGKPPLTTVRPSEHDRLRDLTVCPQWDKCLLVTVAQFSPGADRVLFNGEPHYVYAGTKQPTLIASHYLEASTGAAVVFASALGAWATWMVVGRTLRPVKAISNRMREATARDLSLRVPTPPGDDEIARLAHNSNTYLDRLEDAVTAQRRFASVASHELRSPVAGLHTQLEEALIYPQEVDPHGTIQTALRTTERLQAIIEELLAYARITEAPPSALEPLDLADLVKEEVALLPKGAPIRLHATDHPTVLGNRVQLANILHNLLANAQRHAHSRIDVTVERSGEQAFVTVQDDGAGIAPEDRERVFQPFVRLGDGRRLDPGGSGLGLALSRETAKAHHGSLTIEDSPKGAQFVLRLPLMGPLDAEPDVLHCPGG